VQPFGTNWDVAKPTAVKFYVPPELMTDAEEIFERQGVKLSEGITRLIRMLVEAPEEARPIILGQAHGDAAKVLAAAVLGRLEMTPAPIRFDAAIGEVRSAPPPRRRGGKRG
jgi:hypothetical protein